MCQNGQTASVKPGTSCKWSMGVNTQPPNLIWWHTPLTSAAHKAVGLSPGHNSGSQQPPQTANCSSLYRSEDVTKIPKHYGNASACQIILLQKRYYWQQSAQNCSPLNIPFSLKEVIPLCIYIITLLLYITVNTTTIEYNANATCFDLQQSSSG